MVALFAAFAWLAFTVLFRIWLDEVGRDDSTCPYCKAPVTATASPALSVIGCREGAGQRKIALDSVYLFLERPASVEPNMIPMISSTATAARNVR